MNFDEDVLGLIGAINDTTDFTIRVGSYEWRVHRAKLAAKSTFFKKIAEGPRKENQVGVAELHDQSPFMLARMIQFLYTGTFQYAYEEPQLHLLPLSTLMSRAKLNPAFDEDRSQDEELQDFDIASKMYVLADAYGIQSLRIFALGGVGVVQVRFESIRSAVTGSLDFLLASDGALRAMVACRMADIWEDIAKDPQWVADCIAKNPVFGVAIMNVLHGRQK